ncbi:protein translocase subunit SecF [Gehongia tenuis]|uniref:Protein-export membrane protein SecF n=1 Tax=Gehongia tenuis TaxID=2763655 RepID=A0A926D3W5_9FIRM|nr:protein translocase subunit SecF [Gehongia tenuis]MBC8531076.1 protein translocase subunit SecF [Gehongia tenuis]
MSELKEMRVVEKSKYFFGLSILIILVGVVMLFTRGLNLGIDFTGGTILNIDMKQEFSTDTISDLLKENGITASAVVKAGEGDVQTEAVVRYQAFDDAEAENEARASLMTSIQETYPDAELVSQDRVGATMGSEMVRNACYAVLAASILMLIYIWFRFELLTGVATVVALLHDVFVMIAVMAITGMTVNSGFIAALLTIIGYSINDSIVLFDRIRENNKRFSVKEKSRSYVVNVSVRQCMARTINTTLTTLVAILILYFVGVDSIKEFSLPIIAGLVSGVYSSLFIATPIWALWSDHKLAKRKALNRA